MLTSSGPHSVRAVKGAHPDLNPGDPNAGQKFREIVRANEILGDEEQRA